jgi:hypothetical protein
MTFRKITFDEIRFYQMIIGQWEFLKLNGVARGLLPSQQTKIIKIG